MEKKQLGKELIFLSPAEEVSMADEWFEIASTTHFWMIWRFEIIKLLLIQNKKIKEGQTYLEIGCGHGQFLEQCESELKIVIDGCDLNTTALHKIKHVNGNIYVYNILDLNRTVIDKYHGIFLLDVIEHIDDDAGFLKAALQHLKDDGFVVANVPALPGLFSKYDEVAGHKRRYTKKTLKELFERCDVEVLDVRYWGFSLLFVAWVRKFFLKFVPKEKIISKGFDPGSKFVNGFFNLIMWVEVRLFPNPPLGSSLVVIGKKVSRYS